MGNSAKISLESNRVFVTAYDANSEKLYTSVAYCESDFSEVWGEIQERVLKVNNRNHK